MLARLYGRISGWLPNGWQPATPAEAPAKGAAVPTPGTDGISRITAGPDPLHSPWRESVFGIFAGAPNDVLARIVDYVDPQDFICWGSTCRHARAVLRPHQLWCSLPRVLDAVVSLQTLRIAVDQIEQWRPPRAHHWIAQLTTRLRWMEPGTWLAAMQLLLDATLRLPPSRRGEPLYALATALATARANALRIPALELLDTREPDFEQQLYRAIRSLADIDDARAMRAFAMLLRHGSYAHLRSRSPEAWVAEIAALPEAWRASALAALQARTDNHVFGRQQPAWSRRLELALTMPADDRDLALVALAVPNACTSETMAVQRFDAMLPIAASLPLDGRAGLYAALACLCMVLPRERQAVGWSRLMDLTEALPDPHRGKAIVPLYGAIGCMQGPEQQPCLGRIEAYLAAAMPAIWTEPLDDGVAPAGDGEALADLRIHVRGTDIPVSLPCESSAALARFLHARRAAVEDLPIAPLRRAQMPARLFARALQTRAARLQNMRAVAGIGGYSFELGSFHWDRLLASASTLPEEVRRAPLRTLAQVADRAWSPSDSVCDDGSRAELFPIPSDVFGAGSTTDAVQGWWKVKAASPSADWIALTVQWQREPVPKEMWEFGYHLLLSRATGWQKTELLIWLCRASSLVYRPDRWTRLFDAAGSLPPLHRLRVMQSLAGVFPHNAGEGGLSAYRQRLAADIAAIYGGGQAMAE
ncbi:hypothetical protein J5T34_14360 [Cupriavidus gilardii]|uniref:hypothetical protein n=1 Tax=Cupriavidus gilardii TaxID=82541 RepID=UPI001ABE4C1D|nr:hypothetical protein [Cupriavidus gilardii]MBO4121911.1 hypothetical protein [Cupriavidus gilardii]